MKKILFCVFILVVIFIIGYKVKYKSNIILSFGNNNIGNYNYYYNDTRIKDILYDIDNNIKIKDKYIQNILVRSKYIYINLNNLVINTNIIKDLELLFKLIRKYTKEKIVIIPLTNGEVIHKSVNNWIFKNKDKYDIIIER